MLIPTFIPQSCDTFSADRIKVPGVYYASRINNHRDNPHGNGRYNNEGNIGEIRQVGRLSNSFRDTPAVCRKLFSYDCTA